MDKFISFFSPRNKRDVSPRNNQEPQRRTKSELFPSLNKQKSTAAQEQQIHLQFDNSLMMQDSKDFFKGGLPELILQMDEDESIAEPNEDPDKSLIMDSRNNSEQPFEQQYVQQTQAISQPLQQQITNKAVLEVDPRIRTVRLRLVLQDIKASKYACVESAQKLFVEVKAKDVRFKELNKQIFICYSLDQFFSQLALCPFLRAFKPFSRSHIESTLLPPYIVPTSAADLKKISSQKLRYYITKTEEGEYHGQYSKFKVPEGSGMIYFRDGKVYQGAIKCRQRNGEGSCRWPNGALYTGQWRLDAMEGFGKLFEGNEEVYEGQFLNNLKDGQGTVTWKKSGSSMTGMWKNGQQEGTFVMKSQGREVIIKWKNGQIIDVNDMKIHLNPNDQNFIVLDFKKQNILVEHSHQTVQTSRF